MGRPLSTHRRLLSAGAIVLAAAASIATSEEEPQARSAPARQTLQVAASSVATVEFVASVPTGAFTEPVEVLWRLDLTVDAAAAPGPLAVTVRSDVDPASQPATHLAAEQGAPVQLEGIWRKTRCEPSLPCELRFTVAAEGEAAQVPVNATVSVTAPGRARMLAPTLEAR